MFVCSALLCVHLASGATAASDDFNFDLMEAPPPAPASDMRLSEQAATRRSMLTWHQGLGLATLGVMAATVVLGQLNINDLYAAQGGHTGNFRPYHQVGAYATTALFLTTGSLSLFAPEPYEKHGGADTALVHKVLVGVSAGGMLAQVVLGFVTARSADAGNARHINTLATVHQVVGYTTLAALGGAALVWVF